jgi:phosphohistidine phosphatase SixA
MRFNEKGTEQAFKDFTLPLQNVFNFFETYAKIDQWKSDGTEVYFMRHAEANNEGESDNFAPLTEQGKASLESKEFIEKVLRLQPDIILDNEFLRVQETAKAIQKIMKDYANKEVEIISETEDFTKEDNPKAYLQLLQQHKGKKILIISNKGKIRRLRNLLYGASYEKGQFDFQNTEVIELPTYALTNDLDKRILAELNKTLIEVDGHLQNYILDEATKSAMDFMDKLTNRRLRRSRRRFRSNGMNEDKYSAYATLYHVLKRYLQSLAPFTPFITEYLRLQLATFVAYSPDKGRGSEAEERFATTTSIHLSTRPIANEHYINETLIDETTTIRKIIKLALFVRAKNKIAVKQPLQKLEIKID